MPAWAGRLAWTLAGVALINWSVQLLAGSTSFAWVGIVVVVTGAWGLGTVIVSWISPEQFGIGRRVSDSFAWATAAMVILALGAWCYVQVRTAPGYGTDELAFDQYAAMLVQHGLNPYVHSMAPAFAAFRVSPDGFTYTLSGHAVTQLSYPALSFLLYLPFLALGWSTQMAVVVNVAAWCLSVLLVFALLPRSARAVGLVLASVSVYVSYAVGGITDVLYVPMLIGAVYLWPRFGRSRAGSVGPVLLGLAMSVKQTPWLIFAFVICGLIVESLSRDDDRVTLRRTALYAGLVAVGFLAANLPFMVMDLHAWLSGILVPITGGIVPAGQGAVALSLFVGIGGGSLAAFTVATVLLGVLTLLLYVLTYPALRPVTFLLPAVVLFFAARSYGSYLVALVPAALVGALTDPVAPFAAVATEPRPPSILALRGRLAATVAVAVGFAVAIGWALLDSAPLGLRVLAARTTGQLATIEQLTVRVTNRSTRRRSPAFTIDEGGELTTFWRVVRGPRSIPAGHSAQYVLQAPNFPAQPSLGGGFTVVALSRSPDAISVSRPYQPSTLHLGLLPDAVNTVVPLNRPVVIRAELLNQLDRRVRQGGVAVYLGQIIYDQSGLEYSEAQINGRPPGQTPVTAYTNADGIATFRIVDGQSSADPVYFEANIVNSEFFFPYGYSEILPIQFGAG